MTRKAGTYAEDTRKRILEEASIEFASKGFQASSLRNICKNAGVTTGALYFSFESKAELFNEIITSVSQPCLEFLKKHFETETTYAKNTFDRNEEEDIKEFEFFLNYYYDNKTNFDVLLRNRSHFIVERFLNQVVKLYENHYLTLLHNIAKVRPRITPIDEYAVKWFARTDMEMALNLLSAGFSHVEAKAHAKNLVKIMESGFTALL